MIDCIENLVFEGGGILGIAYLGVLDYLFQNNHMGNTVRVAGTSAGAITACITSFQLPFEETKALADSLNFKEIPDQGEIEDLLHVPEEILSQINLIYGNVGGLYRLIKDFGWFSTNYFYSWLRTVIQEQFNEDKKKPPYTFTDFLDPTLHKQNRPFLDLYLVGTNVSSGEASVFSFETTPDMEVAEAVRISMSIPLFFEAVKIKDFQTTGNHSVNVFCDGGLMNNYPIHLFDSPKYNSNLFCGANMNTLGARFNKKNSIAKITNLLEYIQYLLSCSTRLQQDAFERSPLDRARSISINTLEVSSMDFNIAVDDQVYQFLYRQGYNAALEYFQTERIFEYL
jgi:NTE family protein